MRFHIAIAAAVAVGLSVLGPLPSAQALPTPPGVQEIDGFPIATGNYSSPPDFYGLFFRTPDGRFCGIRPNRGPVGCDAVPGDAPAGTNQTFVESGAPASYRYTGTASFTRDVDVLPVGYRLESWGASCGVVDDVTVTCKTSGRHGFSLNPTSGVLW
ncbi:hypothetical protein ACRCUN_10025 [Mycobacterium sp. LTG2003]